MRSIRSWISIVLFIFLSHILLSQSKIISQKQKPKALSSDSCLEAKNLLEMGVKLFAQNQFDSAISYFHLANNYCKHTCSIDGTIYRFLGSGLSAVGRASEGTEAFAKALPLLEKNSYEEGEIFYFLSINARVMHNIEIAKIYAYKALHHPTSIERDSSLFYRAASSLGNILSVENKTDSALFYHKLSASFHVRKCGGCAIVDHFNVAEQYLKLFRLSRDKSELNEGLSHLHSILSLIKKYERNDQLIMTYAQIASYNFMLGKVEASAKYFKLTDSIAKSQKTKIEYAPYYAYRGGLHAYKGEFTDAMDMFELTGYYWDSITTARASIEFAEAEARFHLLENESQNKELSLGKRIAEERVSKQKAIIITVVVIMLLLSVLLLIIFKQRKHVFELNDTLNNQNESLKGLIKDKDHFMGMLTHDLRSPISSIVGVSELVLESEMNNPNSQSIREIKKSAVESLQMMNKVLELYRFETEQANVEFELVELCQVCRHMVRRYEPLASAKGQQINIMCEAEVAIRSKPTMLKSILGNLISNSIKYNKPGGVCTISCSIHPKKIRLQIEDNGPGFTEADRKNVFGKFQKLTAQPTGNESSSGLGLYMVQLMVEKIGGTIVLSESSEKGATFVLELPK